MIRSFRHKGLKRFYERGDRSGINPNWRGRVEEILFLLEVADSPKRMHLPGYRLHELRGDLAGYWSVMVSHNWRIIFRFEGEDVCDVNLVDYH